MVKGICRHITLFRWEHMLCSNKYRKRLVHVLQRTHFYREHIFVTVNPFYTPWHPEHVQAHPEQPLTHDGHRQSVSCTEHILSEEKAFWTACNACLHVTGKLCSQCPVENTFYLQTACYTALTNLLAHDGQGTSPQPLHPLLLVDFGSVAHHPWKQNTNTHKYENHTHKAHIHLWQTCDLRARKHTYTRNRLSTHIPLANVGSETMRIRIDSNGSRHVVPKISAADAANITWGTIYLYTHQGLYEGIHIYAYHI